MSKSVSAEESCFNFILKKGHSVPYAKDFLYNTKLSVFGGMSAEKCVLSLVRKKVVKNEEDGWLAVRDALKQIFK